MNWKDLKKNIHVFKKLHKDIFKRVYISKSSNKDDLLSQPILLLKHVYTDVQARSDKRYPSEIKLP